MTEEICTNTDGMVKSRAIENKTPVGAGAFDTVCLKEITMSTNSNLNPDSDSRQTSLFEVANSSFHIKREHNNYLLQDQNFQLTDPETLHFVIQELSKTLKILRSREYTQQDLIVDSTWESVELIASQATWLFQPYIAKARALGTGVYFAQHSSMPGLLKIGMTMNFRQRMRTLRDEAHRANRFREKDPMVPIAFAETANYKLFERDLHRVFGYCRIEGEWFEMDPIWQFVDQYRG